MKPRKTLKLSDLKDLATLRPDEDPQNGLIEQTEIAIKDFEDMQTLQNAPELNAIPINGQD